MKTGPFLLIAVSLLASLPAETAVPPFVRPMIAAHCARCHDADHELDLRTLPEESDTAAWRGMLEKLEGFEMPPPAKEASLAKRFPLDPQDRRRLVEAIAGLLGPAADPKPSMRHLSQESWMSIVREVAAVARVPADRVERILSTSGAFLKDMPASTLSPIHQVRIDVVSGEVCDAIADAELEAAPAKRTFLASRPADAPFAAVGPMERRALAKPFLRALFAEDPPPVELERAAQKLARYQGAAESWRDVWVAFCAGELSGPRLLFESYRGKKRP